MDLATVHEDKESDDVPSEPKGRSRIGSLSLKTPQASQGEKKFSLSAAQAGMFRGTKRYNYQAKRILAEQYILETKGNEKEWAEISWRHDKQLELDENHTVFLSFHALAQLRNCLAKGVVILDADLDDRAFSTAFKFILEEMSKKFKINDQKIRLILNTLSKSQKYLPDEEQRRMNIIAKKSYVPRRRTISPESTTICYETAQIFASEMVELDKTKFAMIRLHDALDNVRHPEAPVRFIFVLLGPASPDLDYEEVGRSIATLVSNSDFQELAYKAVDRQDLVFGMDGFLDKGIFIPPNNMLEQSVTVEGIQQAMDKRLICHKKSELSSPSTAKDGLLYFKEPPRDPLKRTGKLFGGLVLDLKDRIPKYLSDFTDALSFQTITSIFFLFFACFAPAITFGGLMGAYTDNSMGAIEALIAQCMCSLIFAFLSAQPLLLLSSTGPVLIFEAGLFSFCQQLGLDFLTIRVWAGIWVLSITFVVVMLEGSALLRYVTRFTEEIFATLISMVFVMESMKFLKQTFNFNPVKDLMHYWHKWEVCNNKTNVTAFDSDFWAYQSYWKAERRDLSHFAFLDKQASVCFDNHQPDTFLLTIIMLFGTFAMAYLLKSLRSSHFLNRQIRQAIGDFGMLISIGVVALFDYVIFPGVFLQRLNTPLTVDFTSNDKRGNSLFISWMLPGDKWWGYFFAFIPAFLVFILIFVETEITQLLLIKNASADKWWGYFFAFIPAFLVFILIFVETEITQLLLIKKGRGLVKGSGGLHWDMLLVGVLTLVCSIFGLPWMCAAAAQSLAHASSLTVMKPTRLGEKPVIDRVIEQRVTAIVVAALLGVCAFASRFLRFLPLAVLFGVFFYLGFMGLIGMQFVHRLILFFIPAKYFPDVNYCQKVKPWKIHVFTFIQLICVIIVYTVKSIKMTALIFPLVLLLTCVLRHKALTFLFSNEELNALDGEHEGDDDADVNDVFSALKF